MGKAVATLTKTTAPALLRRASADIPTDDLTPVERSVRDIRLDFINALGGDPTAGQLALIDHCVLDCVIHTSLQRYILQLCEADGLVDKSIHSLYPCIVQYVKISKAAQSRLKLLRLHERGEAKPIPLDIHIAQWRATQGMPNSVPASQAKPVSDTQAQDSATKPKAKKAERRPPKGKSVTGVGGVVTPPPSIDSSNSVDDPNQNLPGDRNEP
jgi:hypothetical protein